MRKRRNRNEKNPIQGAILDIWNIYIYIFYFFFIYNICTMYKLSNVITCHSGPVEQLQQVLSGIVQSRPMQGPSGRTV